MPVLTRTEEMLLLAVCKLQTDAFGINIRKTVEQLTGKRYSVGGIYVPLDRLVKRGLLTSEEGYATAERMGRPKRLYRVSAAGFASLRETRDLHEAMWSSLPEAALNRLSFG